MADPSKTNWDAKQAIIEGLSITRQFSCGGLSTFGVEHGFLEGVLRGLRSGFITDREYAALSLCTTFEDFKLSLGDTDYCQVLQNVSNLNQDLIYERCVDKFVREFEFLRGQACGSLSTFMDFMTYQPMIDNISFVINSLIKKSKSREEFDPAELLAKCDRIGDDPHLKLIMSFERSGPDSKDDGLLQLYRTVLVETPVARYFAQYFNRELTSEAPSGGIGKAYEEEEYEVITLRMQKLCLEDFYQYAQTLGGDTAAYMALMLGWEADSRALRITMRSFNSDLNDANSRDSDRKNLYCNFGAFYPNGTWGAADSEASFARITDNESLEKTLETFYKKPYHDLWSNAVQQGDTKNFHEKFENALDKQEIEYLKRAFDGQSHFAAFYAWYKLKRFELRNIKWLLACITQKNHRSPPKEQMASYQL